MSDAEKEAQKLMLEANKKMQSRNIFHFFFGNQNKMEDAIEIYQKAANLFKLSKNWPEAASAFCKAANLCKRSKEQFDAATNFVLASKCYIKSDFNNAINCLLNAIEIYVDMGKFVTAAKHHQTIAEIYEVNLINPELAAQHYEQAADYFTTEENHIFAKKCLLKVAQFASETGDYKKAIEIYEEVATSDLKSAILKYSAREIFFRAALCYFCADALNAKNVIDSYIRRLPEFEDSRECKFLKKILLHLEECDVDGFTATVSQFDEISHLDGWKIKMLLKIKAGIGEVPDLL